MKKTALSLTLAALLAGASMHATAGSLDAVIARANGGDTAAMLEAGSQLIDQGRAVEGLMFLEAVVRLGRPEEHVARSHHALGRHYQGLGSPIGLKTAIEHFRSGAVIGYVPSQVELARVYLAQSRSERSAAKTVSLDRALVLLEHAASHGGSPEAAYLLGERFYKGIDFTRNESIGEAWLRHAATKGHADAALAIGLHDLSKGRPEGRRFLAQAAEAGNGEAMMALAENYQNGKVLQQDLATARTWAARASAAGANGAADLVAKLTPPPPPVATAPASVAVAAVPTFTAPAPDTASAEQLRINELERNNRALMAQIDQLRQQMEQIANRDSTSPTRATSLPTSLEAADTAVPVRTAAAVVPQPQAVPLPPPDAASISTPPVSAVAAAAQEPAPVPNAARVRLSENERGLEAYRNGDAEQAAKHFARAVRSGNADAMNNLGMLLLQGQGVAVDRERAMSLFRDAAEKGHVVAARNIGYMYQQGMGVRQDLARANVWIRHASLLERRQLQRGGAYANL